MNRLNRSTICFVVFAAIAVLFASAAFAQSRDQYFPSPITTNEISGRIPARDIGDSRSTSYFYAFNGEQGDIFINVVTKNFEGSIDVFTVAGLNPLAKMVIYSEVSQSETGRLIYLRKPEKLLLRVEGRSPNDDPADFRIKFAGSFVALAPNAESPSQALPSIAAGSEDTGIRVNSVGTIIEVIKKPQSAEITKPSVKVAVKDPSRSEGASVPKNDPSKSSPVQTGKDPLNSTAKKESAKPTKTTKEIKPVAPKKPAEVAVRAEKETNESAKKKSDSDRKVETGSAAAKTKDRSTKPVEKAITPDPMANIRLVIELKDGTSTWRPMNEVLKFGVDRGILTVITKDGNITRYQIVDVAKITMQ